MESSTNSEIGSQHWYYTLVGDIKHIGEYIRDHEVKGSLYQVWGDDLYNKAKELLEGYEKINK
jgi:hypothetical protein